MNNTKSSRLTQQGTLQQFHRALSDYTRPSFEGSVSAPTLIFGLGTSGSDCALRLYRKCRKYFGRTPNNVRFLLLDADKDSRRNVLNERKHISFISIGKTGAGTNTRRGQNLADLSYEQIVKSIMHVQVRLMKSIDGEFPTNLPGSENQSITIISGLGGGAGGGSVDRCVTAAHDAARRVGIENIDVNLATIGPMMPISDVTRTIEPSRVKRILANAADNVQNWFSQMNSRGQLQETPPIGKPFSINASTRILSRVEYDNKSESSRIHTCPELHQMIAETQFFRIFTASGKDRDSRSCDERINGTTGQLSPATATIEGVLQ